jgi:hypothetical protein
MIQPRPFAIVLLLAGIIALLMSFVPNVIERYVGLGAITLGIVTLVLIGLRLIGEE